MKITERTLAVMILKVELTYAIPDMAVIEDFYSTSATLEDDLAEYFELPEIPLILELGISYEFEAPPRPGDPYLMHIQSKIQQIRSSVFTILSISYIL